jgi:uncharacterized protein DUF742
VAADDASEQPAHGRIRPFVLTSGRVAGAEHVGLETQVVARVPGPDGLILTPELVSILALCAEPMSVAEISALVPLHFGVARVLVNDLSAAGHVDVYVTDEAMAHDPDFIMRVIRGLRAL